jgi:hypothetical protein
MFEIKLTKKEKEIIDRKLSIDQKTGCWNWTGALSKGYGIINYRGRTQKVHRVMYAYLIESIPIYNGVDVLDHVVCNNKACCNPKHMKLVKQSYNILRANSVSGKNSRKTHCIRGHLLPKPNEKLPNGNFGRRCVKCRNINKMNRYYSQKTSGILGKEFS